MKATWWENIATKVDFHWGMFDFLEWKEKNSKKMERSPWSTTSVLWWSGAVLEWKKSSIWVSSFCAVMVWGCFRVEKVINLCFIQEVLNQQLLFPLVCFLLVPVSLAKATITQSITPSFANHMWWGNGQLKCVSWKLPNCAAIEGLELFVWEQHPTIVNHCKSLGYLWSI